MHIFGVVVLHYQSLHLRVLIPLVAACFRCDTISHEIVSKININMACQFTSVSSIEEVAQSLTEFLEDQGPSLQFIDQVTHVTELARGGVVIQTILGPIQFGIPPETVKDSLNLGLKVPTYYIVPSQRFNKETGLNVAEFEFPAYYNFFIKNSKIVLICTAEAAETIRTVFQETLLGPKEMKNLAEDFHDTYPPASYPDFSKELSYFSRNPRDPTERLSLDHLLAFEIFDANGQVTLQNEEATIQIRGGGDLFEIIQNGQHLATIPDDVKCPKEYVKYRQSIVCSLRVQFYINHQSFDIRNEEQVSKSVVMWSENHAIQRQIKGFTEHEGYTFYPPDLGVTVLGCSHGFDPKGSTSGYLFWVNGQGIMVDPPPFASIELNKMGISASHITAIIISHCHADHDAGAFHKILLEQRVEIITTRTIMGSFLRKYSAISGLSEDQLQRLFVFRPATIGCTLNIYGGQFKFHYSLHTIPCIGFEVSVRGKSIYFSGDTFYDPIETFKMQQQGLLSVGRYKQLSCIPFNQDIILHEAGIPPIHTSQSVLEMLDEDIKRRLYLVHIAERDVRGGLKIAKPGIENTMILLPSMQDRNNDTLKQIDLFSKIDLFSHLSISNVRRLIDSMEHEVHQPRSIVMEEGTEGNRFYIIEYGIAKVYSNKKGEEFERYYQTGDYFGEQALIENTLRQATQTIIVIARVQAVSELGLYTLKKHEFWYIFGDGSDGKGPILQKLQVLSDARKSKAILVLLKNSVMSTFNPSQKVQLEMILEEQRVLADTVLWRVGDEPQFAFIIKAGSVQFMDSEESHLGEFTSGSFLGEVRAMYDSTRHTTSVKATEDSLIFVIQRSDLIGFLDNNPGLHIFFLDYNYIE